MSTNAENQNDQSEDEVTGFAVFAKYDGVDGESAQAGHDNWITLDSVSFAVLDFR